MSKPREFWIRFTNIIVEYTSPPTWKDVAMEVADKPTDGVHVIEYSEYERLKEWCNTLNRELETRTSFSGALLKERDELKAQLESTDKYARQLQEQNDKLWALHDADQKELSK